MSNESNLILRISQQPIEAIKLRDRITVPGFESVNCIDRLRIPHLAIIEHHLGVDIVDPKRRRAVMVPWVNIAWVKHRPLPEDPPEDPEDLPEDPGDSAPPKKRKGKPKRGVSATGTEASAGSGGSGRAPDAAEKGR